MNTYTVFCRESNGTGTTWISAVEAESLDEAKAQGHFNCCWDWGVEDDSSVTVIGVAEGDINILFWEDI